MKKYVIGSALALTAIGGTASATNGANIIGIGIQSRALGGTGTAAYFGAESLLNNPALMGKEESAQLDFSGTIIMPDIEAKLVQGNTVLASDKSKSDLFAIPEINYVGRINENWTFGFGINGTSGIGVDYRRNDNLFNAYTNLQVMRISGAVAYNDENFGVGFAPILQHGVFSISYKQGPNSVSNGDSTDLGFGFLLGGYYNVNKNITIGASYQSKIKMTYDYQNSIAAASFGPGVKAANGGAFTDDVDQPAEWRLGIVYEEGPWSVSADYKRIEWNKANGYKFLNWQNQDVFGIGVKYQEENFWVGAGFSHTKDQIDVLPADPTNFQNQAVNLMNNHFFPAIMKNHYTLGAGVNISDNIMLQGALVYSSNVDKKVEATAITGSHHTVSHSQTAVSVGIKIKF